MHVLQTNPLYKCRLDDKLFNFQSQNWLACLSLLQTVPWTFSYITWFHEQTQNLTAICFHFHYCQNITTLVLHPIPQHYYLWYHGDVADNSLQLCWMLPVLTHVHSLLPNYQGPPVRQVQWLPWLSKASMRSTRADFNQCPTFTCTCGYGDGRPLRARNSLLPERTRLPLQVDDWPWRSQIFQLPAAKSIQSCTSLCPVCVCITLCHWEL